MKPILLMKYLALCSFKGEQYIYVCVCYIYVCVYITLHNVYISYYIWIVLNICIWNGIVDIHMECLCCPECHMLKPNPQCDTIWSWGLWEVIKSQGRTLTNGIHVLIYKRPQTLQRVPLPFLPCEDTA